MSSSYNDRERILDEFEARWLSGDSPEVAVFVGQFDITENELLIELLQSDLEFRYKSNPATRIEVYLETFQELKANRDHMLRMIASEYRLRRRNEQELDGQEFVERFPALASRIPAAIEQLTKESRGANRDALSMSALMLRVVNGPSTGIDFEIPINRPLIVGRGLLNDTNLDDPLMSRTHFQVEKSGVGCRAQDLGSKRGIRINGHAVTDSLIRSGDLIQAGDTFFRLQVSAPV